MKDRFWLRHPSLHGHLGPYTEAELRAAIEVSAFPRDSYVLRDEGQDETQRMASPHWRPVTTLLGMAPPPAQVMASATSPPSAAATRRMAVRAETAYGGLRLTIHILVGLMLVGLAIALVASLSVGGNNAGATCSAILLYAAAVMIVAGMLQALLDIADCCLQRRDPD